MRALIALTVTLVILGACSSPSNKENTDEGLNYGQMENNRDFGVVLSQHESQGTNFAGIARSLNSAGGSSGATVTSSGVSLGNSSSFFGSLGSSSSDNKMQDILIVHYVVRKDNNQTFELDQVPQVGEPIIYPGQRVVIQTNGKYTKIYPADVENRFQQ